MNQIQTKPLCVSSLNLSDMLTMVKPIDFGGHSLKVKVTMGIIDKFALLYLYFPLIQYFF